MVADRHSPKSLRLTAMDNNGQVKIFLVMARQVDIIILHKALSERISSRKNLCPADRGLDVNKAENGNSTKNKSNFDEHCTKENPEQKTTKADTSTKILNSSSK